MAKTKTDSGKQKKADGFVKKLFKQKPLSAVGLVILCLFVLCAIFADFIAPEKMVNGILPVNLMARLQKPSAQHLFGTDALGHDMLSYMIYGTRTSVILAVACTAIATVVSVVLGVASATIGGWFDLILQRFVDSWMSIPSLLISLILMSMLGNGIPQLILVLSIPSGISGTRIIRSSAYQVKDMDYVTMGKMMGAGKVWLMLKHVTPNILPMMFMSLAAGIGGTIMTEASLSFLGYGVAANTPDWGAMLTSGGRDNMYIAPWLCLIPGIAISLIVFSSAMFSDGMRDLLDPRLKGGTSSYKQKKKKNAEAAARSDEIVITLAKQAAEAASGAASKAPAPTEAAVPGEEPAKAPAPEDEPAPEAPAPADRE